MDLTRRDLLRAGVSALPLAAWGATARGAPAEAGDAARPLLGLVIHSFPNRVAADRGGRARFDDADRFLDYCHGLGARGVQVGLGRRSPDEAARLRRKVEGFEMYLEGIVRLPRDPGDIERFSAEIQAAQQCGATVVRTVMLSGRRYETFDSEASFRRFAEESFRALGLAEPVVTRHDVLLAVENHKDWRAEELIAILKRIGSEHVGVCLDTGNSIALLEDPMEVVEALAPWALTTHFKDMAVREYPEGFLLAEVPLGEGFLDLPRIIRILRRARPRIRFNLEMITRDPLQVPCLADRYWATFPNLPGRVLARSLAMVRARASDRPLQVISNLDPNARIEAEDENIRRSLAYAREHLT